MLHMQIIYYIEILDKSTSNLTTTNRNKAKKQLSFAFRNSILLFIADKQNEELAFLAAPRFLTQ